MAIEEHQVGNVAAQLMEELSQTYGDDASIETVALVAAVKHTDGTKMGVHFRFTENTAPHVAVGLMEFTSRALGPPPISS